MTRDKHQQTNLGKILSYVITSTNMDQKWLASSLDISSSSLSRMMSGAASPKLEFWERISKQYGINFDAIQTGIITTYPQDSDIIFKRFAPTRKDNYTLGNGVLMHKSIFIKFWGEKTFEDFCLSLQINPLIFVNGNNPANLDFTLRMIQFSILKGKLKNLTDIENYSDHAYMALQKKERLHHIYSKEPGIEKVASMVNSICGLYEQNHSYKIEDLSLTDQWIDISFCPKEHVHLKMYKYDPILGNSFEKFIHFYIAKFMGRPVKIQTINSLFKGDERCIFRLLRK